MFRPLTYMALMAGLLFCTHGVSVIQASINDSAVILQLNSGPVSMATPLITIGDVASVTCDDERLRERIQKLDVEILDSNQASVLISRQQIRMRMLVAGVKPSQLSLHGPQQISVVAAEQKDAGKTIERYVARAFSEQFAVDEMDVRVRLLKTDNNRQLAELAHAIESAMIIFPLELPVGEAEVAFEFVTRNREDSRMELRFQFSVIKEIAVAGSTIARGTKIASHHLRKVKRPITRSSILSATFEESIGKIASTDIPAHSVLRASYFARVRHDHAVKRNDIVDVVIQRPGFTMRLRNAKVQKPGFIGDVVQVLNTQTGTTMNAVVVSKTTVEVR